MSLIPNNCYIKNKQRQRMLVAIFLTKDNAYSLHLYVNYALVCVQGTPYNRCPVSILMYLCTGYSGKITDQTDGVIVVKQLEDAHNHILNMTILKITRPLRQKLKEKVLCSKKTSVYKDPRL